MKAKIYRRKDSKSVWVSYYGPDGKRVQESLDRIISRSDGKKCKNNSSDLLLYDYLTDYINGAHSVKSLKTQEAEKSLIRLLREFLGSRFERLPLSSFGKPILMEFKLWLRKRGLAKATVNLYLRHLRAILGHAVRIDLIEKNPLSCFDFYKLDEKELRFMTAAESESLLEAASCIGWKIHIACALGIYAGLRKKEISFSRWEWVDFDAKTITVSNSADFRTKSGRRRTIPLSNKLAALIKPYSKSKGYILEGAGSLYRYDFRNPFLKARKLAGLEWVTPHILRHTFASQLAIAGVSLYKIQKWLGHSDPKTTEIYAHLQAQDDDINKI